MPTFYDRYQGGEHKQVWSELIELGEAVRQEPVYPDAVAVARETMRRTQSNIETLIDRLHLLGYEFDNQQRFAQRAVSQMEDLQASIAVQLAAHRANQGLELDSLDYLGPKTADQLKRNFIAGLEHMANLPDWQREMMERMKTAAATSAPAHPREDPSVYSRATGQASTEITAAESELKGFLPLSLRVWYETIQYVSFIGSHPVLNPREPDDARPTMYVNPALLQGFDADQRKKQVESFGFNVQHEVSKCGVNESALPDPLAIMPIEELLGDLDEQEEDIDVFMIAPDDLHKANISGDAYYVKLPDKGADVIFQDWSNDYFVAYLRRVFAWGGFPGWERHPNPPWQVIKELADGLLPI